MVFYSRKSSMINKVIVKFQADKDSTSTTLFILSVASICLTVLCLIFYVIRPDALTSLSEKSMLWASMAMALSSIIYLLSLAYRNQVKSYSIFAMCSKDLMENAESKLHSIRSFLWS